MILQPTFKKLKAFSTYFVLALGIFTGANDANAVISQAPLVAGSTAVPGSLALTPSVEYPTILTLANLGTYSANTVYAGYFDSKKCYTYTYIANETTTNVSRFTPSSVATTATCANNLNNGLWSGNYLNWAATQTIDPFRSALTGGYRYVDTTTLTVLQKARHTGQGGYNSERTISATVAGSSATVRTRLNSGGTGYGYKMQITLGDNWSTYCTRSNGCTAQQLTNKTTSTYQGGALAAGVVYEASVRVEVCKATMPESNCVQYGSNWKPEGLIQQYAGDLRYSVFGYLNDSSATRDGGVLRAAQKYVGPTLGDLTDNTKKEWSATTGVMVQNPDSITSSMGVTIENSGVLNYLNKFGELTTNLHKSFDPVSELYYTAIRYFKGMQPVSTYSSYTAANGTDGSTAVWADKFPVISNWTGMDPVTYACQKNFILGIGDTNSHKDKNLPSAEATSGTNEPAKPQAVRDDTTVDVVAATRQVQTIERNDTPAIDLKVTAADFRGGNNNSAYIVGLAYDSHTKDIRPQIDGSQTVSTFWVDVREGGTLQARALNQYWLAAKYGGFKVPTNYGNPYERTTTLDTAWWTNSTADAPDLTANNDMRPTNFFVASDATLMIKSLKSAFANIVAQSAGTATALASNSTQLDTGSAIFQSAFNNTHWSGDLSMKTIDDGVVQPASWSAAAVLDARNGVTTRNIYTANTLTPSSDATYSTSTTGVNFDWSTLDADTKAALKATSSDATSVGDSVGELRVNYLRGDRTQERTANSSTQPFRQRGSRLGDIINSDPVFIAKQDYGYNLLRSSRWTSNGATAGAAYLTFRSSDSYQGRTPLVVVGANDGMLHGFNASETRSAGGGDELFAYVPRSIAGQLYRLTSPDYVHRYYVDGPATSSDAWINDEWKTLVVGTTGAGGNSVFALDVTNPSSMSSSNVLWEFTAPDMGATMFKPSIIALANGKFAVLVSSGYSNSAVTAGHVWLLDAADGSVIKKFDLPTTGYLGEPLAIDLNNDRMAERVYVGDTMGKLWRIDLNGTSVNGWGVPSSLESGGEPGPLFTAQDDEGNVQPITAPLSAALNKDGNPIILFGTGTFYQTTDTDLTLTQHTDSFYGIIDTGAVVATDRSTLQAQRIIKQATASGQLKGRVLSNSTISSSSEGWYLDLLWKAADGGSDSLTGERVVSRAVIRSGVVVFATLTPSADPCTGGATSWIMAIDLFSGGRLTYDFFDMNGDGSLSDDDSYTDEETGTDIPYSGRSNSTEGVVKTPTFFNGNGSDGSGGGDDDDDLICIAGSKSGEATCSPAPKGTRLSDRVSWRELR
ncbi:pilus assembly protein [Pseudomonas turukhanskensis]|uniref:PilY1 beta-propeller domain-containing protein n=1 Tax=Pseudomonas turukhanskensis TaxID=1806536 RepID=A0A9W6K9G2_9PSED|nr:PilC/PilY family type IV pilus protein [Pseudomonas turukhanskensis]GLK90726.1 hypothetical protein GCM10017655_37900 [Pseudomonas turukhanskensis]